MTADHRHPRLRDGQPALGREGARARRRAADDQGRPATSPAPGTALILPGVGAFPKAMERVRERGFDGLVRERVEAGAPVLGICLGMQLLFDSSTELGRRRGARTAGGPVESWRRGELKVPHIGWSPASGARTSRADRGPGRGRALLLRAHVRCRGQRTRRRARHRRLRRAFRCAVERGNVFGVQFHPEKSSGAGLRLLRQLRRRSARPRPSRLDPLSGDRHPRRPRGSPDAGRLRARDRVRRRPARRGRALGRGRRRVAPRRRPRRRPRGRAAEPRARAPDRGDGRRPDPARRRAARRAYAVEAALERRGRARGDRNRRAARPRASRRDARQLRPAHRRRGGRARRRWPRPRAGSRRRTSLRRR